jgi:hypothetical protein
MGPNAMMGIIKTKCRVRRALWSGIGMYRTSQRLNLFKTTRY